MEQKIIDWMILYFCICVFRNDTSFVCASNILKSTRFAGTMASSSSCKNKFVLLFILSLLQYFAMLHTYCNPINGCIFFLLLPALQIFYNLPERFKNSGDKKSLTICYDLKCQPMNCRCAFGDGTFFFLISLKVMNESLLQDKLALFFLNEL